MYAEIRDKLRNKVRNLEYVMTIHAEEEMENDDLSILDVESGILYGEIVERHMDSDSGEWKYLISGKSLNDDGIMIVAKLSPTNKLVIVTVYFEEYESEQ